MLGPLSITTCYNATYSMGIGSFKLKAKEVTDSNETVVETGTYGVFVNNGVSIDKCKRIVICKEGNDSWKMHRNICNTDLMEHSKQK